MRRIVFTFETGYVGMTGHDFQVYPDDITNEELDQEAWLGAVQHAESYGIYSRAYYEDDSDTNDEELDSDNYVDSIEGWWEDYDPQKHDGLSTREPIGKMFSRLEKAYNE